MNSDFCYSYKLGLGFIEDSGERQSALRSSYLSSNAFGSDSVFNSRPLGLVEDSDLVDITVADRKLVKKFEQKYALAQSVQHMPSKFLDGFVFMGDVTDALDVHNFKALEGNSGSPVFVKNTNEVENNDLSDLCAGLLIDNQLCYFSGHSHVNENIYAELNESSDSLDTSVNDQPITLSCFRAIEYYLRIGTRRKKKEAYRKYVLKLLRKTLRKAISKLEEFIALRLHQTNFHYSFQPLFYIKHMYLDLITSIKDAKGFVCVNLNPFNQNLNSFNNEKINFRCS